MKQLLYLFVTIFLISCGPESTMFNRQYIIENKSTVPIELQFYSDGELNFRFSTTELQNNEQLKGEILERSGGPWSELNDEELLTIPTSSFLADSVRVIFNNEKLIIYKIDYNPLKFTPSQRNFLLDSDYSDIGKDQFLFTINESDFFNASECNGNCN